MNKTYLAYAGLGITEIKRKPKSSQYIEHLLLFFLVSTLLLLCSGSRTLALDTTRAASTVGRGKSEVNMFLGVQTDNERWDVDDLLANTK